MQILHGRKSFILFAAWGLVCFISSAWAAETQVDSGKVALVNGTVITQKALNRSLAQAQQQFRGQQQKLTDTQLAQFRKQVLDNLVQEELLYQETQKKGIKVKDSDLKAQIATLKNRFPSEEKYKEMLLQMKITERELENQARRGMAIRQFIDEEIGSTISVSEKEQKAFYDGNPALFKKPERVRARHILIKVDPKADSSKKEQARKKIENIQQMLKNGKAFEELAKEFSEGPSNVKGGDLGYFQRGQMVKPFEETAFALKSGEVSDIVETRFGYHLIKVVDKKPSEPVAYEEIKERIGQHLKQQKTQKEVNQYINKLKANSNIEILIN
jgi:peptidyl-prolyl cis-trans isomerase C